MSYQNKIAKNIRSRVDLAYAENKPAEFLEQTREINELTDRNIKQYERTPQEIAQFKRETIFQSYLAIPPEKLSTYRLHGF